MAIITSKYNGIFPERLKQLRLDHDLKQSEVAEKIGVSVQSYSAYENGREPNFATLALISKYFGVTTDFLLGLTDVKKPETRDFLLEFEDEARNYINCEANIKTPIMFIIRMLNDGSFNVKQTVKAKDLFIKILSTYHGSLCALNNLIENEGNRIEKYKNTFREDKMDEKEVLRFIVSRELIGYTGEFKNIIFQLENFLSEDNEDGEGNCDNLEVEHRL